MDSVSNELFIMIWPNLGEASMFFLRGRRKACLRKNDTDEYLFKKTNRTFLRFPSMFLF